MSNDSIPQKQPSQNQGGSIPERQVAREAGQSAQEQQEASENNGNIGQYPGTGQVVLGKNPATGLPHQADPASDRSGEVSTSRDQGYSPSDAPTNTKTDKPSEGGK